jgi:hypothetical protein
VKCWGSNNFGQLNVPRTFSPKNLRAFDDYSCVSDEGLEICWGRDQIPSNDIVIKQLESKNYSRQTCAIIERLPKYGKEVTCWGHYTVGHPYYVPFFKNPTQLASVSDLMCAYDSSRVKCWRGIGFTYKKYPSGNFIFENINLFFPDIEKEDNLELFLKKISLKKKSICFHNRLTHKDECKKIESFTVENSWNEIIQKLLVEKNFENSYIDFLYSFDKNLISYLLKNRNDREFRDALIILLKNFNYQIPIVKIPWNSLLVPGFFQSVELKKAALILIELLKTSKTLFTENIKKKADDLIIKLSHLFVMNEKVLTREELDDLLKDYLNFSDKYFTNSPYLNGRAIVSHELIKKIKLKKKLELE